MMRLGL